MARTIKYLAVLLLGLVTFCGAQSQSSYCETPKNEPGECINIKKCDSLIKLLKSKRTPEQTQYILNSKCGMENNDPLVCCPLLPSECGQDLSNRIVGGEKTELDEFPWMTLLEYDTPRGSRLACGGALISKRYVLTAAHCLRGSSLPNDWTLKSVRLGEYDTKTDPDCIPDGDFGKFCADRPVNVRIANQIVHENYERNSKNQYNDIALLRLQHDVNFTTYIKPICLPRNGNLSSSSRLQVAGWGKTESRSDSDVKLKVSLPLTDMSQCYQKYRDNGLVLGRGQFCAGGERGKDSCRGDSGGPMMQLDREDDGTIKWAVVGVVSFGPSPCGMLGWPGVYTKVHDFMPWIYNKIRP